jgi:hypothetical protein
MSIEQPAESYDCSAYKSDAESGSTVAPSGNKLYYMPFLVSAASLGILDVLLCPVSVVCYIACVTNPLTAIKYNNDRKLQVMF